MCKITKRCKVIVESDMYKDCVSALQEKLQGNDLVFNDEEDNYFSAEMATIIVAGFTTFATIVSALIVAKGGVGSSIIKITTKDYSIEINGSESLSKIKEVIENLDKADSATIKIK